MDRDSAEYAELIRRIVDEAPPLSEDQRTRLASIFRTARVQREAEEGRTPPPT